MSETAVFTGGLSLLTNSPFKKSLPNELKPDQDRFDVDVAVRTAMNENVLYSDVGRFLKQRDHIKYEYYNRINERCLKQEANLISGALHEEMINDATSSHLKIKLLAEFALSKVDKDHSLLKLEGILLLDSQIQELKQEKKEIYSQLELNINLLNNTLTSLGNNLSTGDNDIFRASLSSNQAIVERLSEVNEMLESKYRLLNNQFLMVLSLCYFEDLDLTFTSIESQTKSTDREAEELMSYLVSIAVQKSIALPTPNPEAPKSQWAKDCVDAIIAHTPELQSSYPRSTDNLKDTESSKDKEISKLKTALEDLQFAHQYLTRQFQEERDLNSTTMDTHNKMKSSAEKELSETLILLEKSNQRAVLVEHEKNVLETKLDEKINELNDLKRLVTNLKIENLGFVHTNERISPDKENLVTGSPVESDYFSPTSPLTGIEVQLDNNNLNPKTPLLQKNSNEFKFQSPSSSKFNSSISVLRSEFKKLVNEMHTNFETELSKEKNERKRLENLVRIYEERNNDMDLL